MTITKGGKNRCIIRSKSKEVIKFNESFFIWIVSLNIDHLWLLLDYFLHDLLHGQGIKITCYFVKFITGDIFDWINYLLVTWFICLTVQVFLVRFHFTSNFTFPSSNLIASLDESSHCLVILSSIKNREVFLFSFFIVYKQSMARIEKKFF